MTAISILLHEIGKFLHIEHIVLVISKILKNKDTPKLIEYYKGYLNLSEEILILNQCGFFFDI